VRWASGISGGWCVLIPVRFLDTFDLSKVSPRREKKVGFGGFPEIAEIPNHPALRS